MTRENYKYRNKKNNNNNNIPQTECVRRTKRVRTTSRETSQRNKNLKNKRSGQHLFSQAPSRDVLNSQSEISKSNTGL